MDPLLIDVPKRIVTERTILRRPLAGDGPLLNAAVLASFDELQPWMHWARTPPSQDDSEAYCRRMHAAYDLREDLVLFIFERGAEGSEGELIGACGWHRIDWALRKFEIGYWSRTGHGQRGLVTEAVKAMSRAAFDRLEARRVEIRMDALNERSWRVAERAGFTFEGLLRSDALNVQGEPRNTRVYSRVRGIEEPALRPGAVSVGAAFLGGGG